MPTPINLAIIYYSATGTIHGFALAAADEASAIDGVATRTRKVRELAPPEAIRANEAWEAHAAATAGVPEAELDDLDWADAILFGTPTRFGLPAAQLKQFIDTASPLWQAGKLVNKTVSAFTASQTRHGGQETTIVALNNTFYHWGCLLVPPGYADPIQFRAGNPYGASHTSGTPEQPLPTDLELESVRFQTRRLVEVTQALLRGGLG